MQLKKKWDKDEKKSKLASWQIASLDGTFASEKIIKAFDEIDLKKDTLNYSKEKTYTRFIRAVKKKINSFYWKS